MPFYLVTQTALIEAEDEDAAAQKTIDEIRSGKQVSVTVKFDETTISQVLVAAKSDEKPGAPIGERETLKSTQMVKPDPDIVARADKKALLRRIMTDTLALVKSHR